MSGWGSVLVALALAGCNQLYGLDPTLPEPLDADADGVEDGADNCPTAANTDQTDTDADGFGDACDGCPQLATAANHDEDGDGRGDDCDPCPSAADFGDDFDADGLPNACELDSGVGSLIAFDPFVRVSAEWTTTGVPWQATGDTIAPLQQLAADDSGLRNDSIRIDAIEWYVDLGALSRDRWAAGDRFGIAIRDVSGAELGCEVRCEPDCTFIIRTPTFTSGKADAMPTPMPTLRLASRPTINGHDAFCLLEGSGSMYLGGVGTIVGAPVVYASPNIRLRFVAAFANIPP